MTMGHILWPTWPISQLTGDRVTRDSRLLTTPVTATVWRLRTPGRGKEVSMRAPVHLFGTAYQLAFEDMILIYTNTV